MTKTKQRERGAHDADDPPKDSLNVREEIQKALEDSEFIDVLVSKIKTILVEELTTVLTKKVGDSLRENFEFELASRDEKITSLEKEVERATRRGRTIFKEELSYFSWPCGDVFSGWI